MNSLTNLSDTFEDATCIFKDPTMISEDSEPSHTKPEKL